MRVRAAVVVSACSLLAWACASRQAPPAGSAEPSVREFVMQHRPELEKEIRIGSGPQIYELSRLAHCQDIAELGRALHRKQDEIFPTPAPSDAEVADQVLAIMTERGELRCRDLELGPTRPFAPGRHEVGPEHPQ